MAILSRVNAASVPITIHNNTTNQSFLDMHYYLKQKGIENNAFHLTLFDAGLANINPRDPHLNFHWKQRVWIECQKNFWYFCREIVRIPASGIEAGNGVPYKLHRGNLALNFGFLHNWNMFAEFPRQHGKTVAALVWYLWIFLFRGRSAEMMFFNKKLDDSKMNLQRLRDYRAALPDYLRFDQNYGADGKLLKASNNVQTLSNGHFKNVIKTVPSARNKVAANSLGRGCTIPLLYWDEYAFIPFNYTIYQSAIPAFSTASKNARMYGNPYGILITTTPGDLLTDEGKEAFETKNAATEFNERWYDYSPQELNMAIQMNEKSSFVYIKFSYKQLGSGEDYLDQMVKDLKRDAAAIQREVLLEWCASATNSPFEKIDLDAVKNLIREPIKEMSVFRKNYIFKVYKGGWFKSPPIIGVDVAGGYSKDSSAITIIDSSTTEIIATFKCNYISVVELSRVLAELVNRYFPNAVVNIERNGGFGASVLSYLLEYPNIRRNLYYEIKERVFEERFDGYRRVQSKHKVKVYGLDQTNKTRVKLTEELLKERMSYHKDKFVSREIYEELCQLERKRNGRIEHSDNGHDDLLFSYLLALYVFYEGTDLRERFGIEKGVIRSDEFLDAEELIPASSLYKDISMELIVDDEDDEVSKQLKMLGPTDLMTNEQRVAAEEEQDYNLMQQQIANNPLARKAYQQAYNIHPDLLNQAYYTIPNAVFMDFNNSQEQVDTRSDIQKFFDSITNTR